jgi:hypothetical protein
VLRRTFLGGRAAQTPKVLKVSFCLDDIQQVIRGKGFLQRLVLAGLFSGGRRLFLWAI